MKSIKGYIPRKPVEKKPTIGETIDEFMAKTSGEFDDLASEIVEVFDKELKQIDNKITEVDLLLLKTTQKVDEKLATFNETIDFIHSIPALQGKPGKDANDQEIFNNILTKIPSVDDLVSQASLINEDTLFKKLISHLPKNKSSLKVIQEKFETDPMSVIDKIMALPEGKFKLKTSQIDGLDQTIRAFQSQLGRGYLHGGGISNITGLIQAGTNVTITGLGTIISPYVINSSGGGGGGTVTSVASADGSITVTNPTSTVDLSVVKAPKLTTGRTISISGDLTYASPSFDGSGNITAAGTLATVNSNVGTFGSATQVAQLTVNAKGLTTAVSNVTITPAASSITGGQALTKTDDTNVTLTLGGTPSTALLTAASLTLGWTGQLSLTRGGTGANLSTPGASSLWGFDDTDNAINFWTIGTGLSYDHTTHTLSGTGGSPGGSNTYVQYNDSSTFGGDANFTWDKNNNNLNIGSGANILQINDSYIAQMGSGQQIPEIVFLDGISINFDDSPGVTEDGYGIYLTANNGGATSGNGGSIDIQSGSASTDGAGGNLYLYAGSANSSGSINISDINNPGTGYVVGNILTVSGGNGDATVSVASVTMGGVIDTIVSVNPGTGYTDATGVSLTGGAGSGATIDIVINNYNGGKTFIRGGDADTGDGSGGDIELIPGVGSGLGSNGQIRIVDPFSGNSAFLDTSLLTDNRTFTFPDQSGVFAIVGGSTTQIQYNNAGALGGMKIDYTDIGTSITLKVENAVGADDSGDLLQITGADAGSNSGTGGPIQINAGAGSATSGDGGYIQITGGNSPTVGSGGAVYITAGDTINGSGATVSIHGGNTGSIGNVSGNVNISGGYAYGGGTGGSLVFDAGTGSIANGIYKFSNPINGVYSILDFTLIDTADKTFTFPNESGIFVITPSHARATAQTAANTNILTFTVGSVDATFQVLANVLVTTSTAYTFGVTVDYTDESNISRTLTIPVAQLAGTLITAITNVTGAGPYEGVALTIRAKSGTDIVFKTAGTFTTVTYNVDCSVVQVATT